MKSLDNKLLIPGILVFFIMLSGIWLTKHGKPYPVLIFTLHKLIVLAAIILVGTGIYQQYKTLEFTPMCELLLVLSAVFVLISLVSGALVSIGALSGAVFTQLHRIVPYLAIAVTAILVYFLKGLRNQL